MTSAAPIRLHHGRFVLGRELGQGVTGTVHEAWDALHERTIAIKRLRALDAQSLYLLKREFRAAAEITHENLVRLGELVADETGVFFTMERVRGVDFLSHVRRAEPSPAPPCFDEPRLRSALAQLFAALEALHASGLVHRDVKPSNVLVEADGRVVLLDFGLTADVLGRQDRERGWIVGTPRYMAPEQVRDDRVGPAADAYAAGVMLHEALLARAPIEGSSREIMFGKQVLRVESLAERFPFVPADLDALARDLLRIDPGERPTDAEVLARLGADRERTGRRRRPVREGFVGREAELAALERAHESTSEGSVIAVVRGESGVGKSALVHRFVTSLRASADMHVLRGRCFERESIPFNAIDAVVDALSLVLAEQDEPALGEARDVAALARIFPVLRRVGAIEWIAREQPLAEAGLHELRLRGFRALRHILAELAQRRPLVVVIEDLQWADKDSLALLEELARRPSPRGALFVLTARPGASLELCDADVRTLELAGLEEASAVALAKLVLGDASADVVELAREARGHPLYLMELAERRELRRGGPSLDDVLRLRAGELDRGARQVLELIAIAGMPVRQGVIARAAGLELGACFEAIDALRRERFARTEGTGEDNVVEPYHDRVREALLAALPGSRRIEMHRRLATILEERVDEPRDRAALVHHLQQAGERARAAAHAERAAEELAHALAFDRAADLYRLALTLGTHDRADRARLLLACGHALRDAGRAREAAESFVEAAALAPSGERLALEVAAAEQWVCCGHLERGLALLESVLERLGVRWPRTQAEVLAAFAYERARLALAGIDRVGTSAIAVDERRRLEVFQSIASGLGSIDPLRAWTFQTRALRRILRSGEPELLARGLALEALLSGLEGQSGATYVRRLVARAEELARGSKSERVRAWVELADGGTSYFLGRLASAPRPLAEAELRFRDEVRVDMGGLNVARILKVWTAVFRGDLAALGRWIPEYERDAVRRDDRYAKVSLNLAGHVAWLVDGDLARARAKLRDRAWEPPGGAYHIQSWYALLAECEQALYDPAPIDRAARARFDRGFFALRTSLVFLRAESIRVYGTWLRARYLVALAEQGVEGQVPKARALAGRLMRERASYAAPYAAAIRAACDALEGGRASAIVELRVCEELADQSSLFGLAAMARRRIGELGDRAAERGEAERFFRVQRVADPARMTRMYLPGF